MPITQQVKTLFEWPPLDIGTPAPGLSLTADEGTWIRLPDFKGHINVVLLFFRSMQDDEIDAWLRAFQEERDRFEELEAAMFGVSTFRPERLRAFRNELGLEYYLIYDPMGMESRKFRAASRWRPRCKNTCYVIDKEGNVAFATRGLCAPAEVLSVIARLENADLEEPGEKVEKHGFSAVRNPGQAADRVKNIEPDDAVKMIADDETFLLLDVRTKAEFDADHAPDAVHIPVDELPHRYQEIGQTTHIVCVCQAGGRSALASEFLTSIGCSEVYNVEGGMSSWSGPRVTGGQVAT